MTDEEQNELGLTNTQRIIAEYYENHPEELEKLAKALQPAIVAITDIYVKISEALKPIIDTIEVLIDNEEDSEDD